MVVSDRFARKYRCRTIGATAAAMAGALLVGTARATTYTWNGSGSDNNWNTAANWSGGSAPGDLSSDDLVFAGSTRMSPMVNFNTPCVVNSLSFNAGAGSFSLGGNQIEFNGLSSAINQNATNAQTIANDLLFNVGVVIGGSGSGNLTLSGTLSGAGALDVNYSGTGTISFTGSNTYTGDITLDDGIFQISGANGSFASANNYTINANGSFLANDTTAAGGNKNGRLNSNANLMLNGGAFTLNGTDSASNKTTTESVNQLSIGSGYSTITLSSGASSGDTATLTAASFARTGNGTALLNGTNLGSSSSTFSRLLLTSQSGLTLIGSNTTGTNLPIVPYLIGDTGTGSGNTLVTYDATRGLRPLATSEFATSLTAGNNILLTSSGTISLNSSVAVNSMVLNAGSGSSPNITISSAKVLTVTSGAILFVDASNTYTISGGTVEFGSTEAVISVTSTSKAGTISSTLDGTGGLTKSGLGQLTLSSLTYTGATNIDAGTLVLSGAVLPASSLFVGPTGTLDLGGSSQSVGALSGSGTIGDGSHTSAALASTFNSATSVFSGVLKDKLGSGTPTVSYSKAGSGTQVFTGMNTYSGGTTVTGGTLVANTTGAGNSATGIGAVAVGDSSGNNAFQAMLAGSGNIAGNVTVYKGSKISGGDGSTTTGTLTLQGSTTTLNAGAQYVWKINDASGAAGSTDGWDLLALSNLTSSANAINVQILAPGAGPLTNFNPGQDYVGQWKIATVPTNASTLAKDFVLDTTAINTFISNNPGTKNAFSIGTVSGDNTDIFINYAATPEPTSLALLGLGSVGMMLRRRRSARAGGFAETQVG